MIAPETLYIHIPYCVSKCSYCDFFSKACGINSVPDEYILSLCNEIQFRLKQNNVSVLKTIYIGGGTPSLLSVNQIEQIFNIIRRNAKIAENCEITMEVNPDDVTEEFLYQLYSQGITRLSCGIQSLNESSLKFCGRRASLKQNIQALELFKKHWKGELSLDIICGLPEESEQSFVNGLNKIIEYSPDHISMYSLTVEDETPLGLMVQKGSVKIDYDFNDELWLKGRELLIENGYEHYEVSNFSKPGKQCRHNLVYWQHSGYIGAGSGGCGTVYNNDGTGLRWTNVPDLHKYIDTWKKLPFNHADAVIEEKVDLATSEFEFFMMGFRKLTGITDAEYEACFGKKIPEDKIDIFNKYKENKLLEIECEDNKKRYHLNADGILLLNRFLEDLI